MSDFKPNDAIQKINVERYSKQEKKPFSISHASFVSYLIGAIVKEAIENSVALDYNSIIEQVDNITCNYADEDGHIDLKGLDKEQLKRDLIGILPLSNYINIESVIFNAFSIIWMESQSF